MLRREDYTIVAPHTQGENQEVPQLPGVAIQSATITETKVVKSFKVDVISLDLFKSVTVLATLFCEDGSCVGTRTYTIEGAEYLAWNNDDQYLINTVAQKLGFTLSA